MDEKRLKGIMGLCVRAGQGVFGEDGCRKAIATEQSRLLLLDEGASENTRKRYESLCAATEARLAMLPEGLLQEATGRPGAAMAVKEGNFANQVIGCL